MVQSFLLLCILIRKEKFFVSIELFDSGETKMKILILSANGGIGNAIVGECLRRFPDANIIGTYRRTYSEAVHQDITWFKVDLSSESEVEQLSKETGNVDWIINCTGFLHDEQKGPEKNISSLSHDFFIENINRNTIPTLLLAKYFTKILKQSASPKVAVLSAKVGSIEDNQLGGWYSYRCAKAALNMLIKTISIEWHRVLPKGVIIALHPGTTDTSLSKPFQANVPPEKLFSTQKVAFDLLNVIEGANVEGSGDFYNYAGEKLPW